MGIQPPKSPKLVIFGINLPKRGYTPLCDFFIYNLAWGRESQVHTLIPNFIVVAFNFFCGFNTAPTIAKNGIIAPKGKFRGRQKKLNIGAQLQTSLCAMNDTIIVLKITPLHIFRYHKLYNSKA